MLYTRSERERERRKKRNERVTELFLRKGFQKLRYILARASPAFRALFFFFFLFSLPSDARKRVYLRDFSFCRNDHDDARCLYLGREKDDDAGDYAMRMCICNNERGDRKRSIFFLYLYFVLITRGNLYSSNILFNAVA